MGQLSSKEGTAIPGIPIRKKKESSESSKEAQKLADTLEDLLKVNGVRKLPARPAGLVEADRLLRIDRVPLDQALEVLRFALADDFWKQNILSMGKFREKFETLRLRFEVGRKRSNSAVAGAALSPDAMRTNTAAILASRRQSAGEQV